MRIGKGNEGEKSEGKRGKGRGTEGSCYGYGRENKLTLKMKENIRNGREWKGMKEKERKQDARK